MLKAGTRQASHPGEQTSEKTPGPAHLPRPPATGSAPTPMTFEWFPHSPFFLPGSRERKGRADTPWRPPLVHPVPRGCWWALPVQAGRLAGAWAPPAPRRPPRAPGPCVGCFDSAPEPRLGKPRRTGRHSSFYRPSNWGWSRRGNTKILCTQLLSVRVGLQQNQARGDTFVLLKGSAPLRAVFNGIPDVSPQPRASGCGPGEGAAELGAGLKFSPTPTSPAHPAGLRIPVIHKPHLLHGPGPWPLLPGRMMRLRGP